MSTAFADPLAGFTPRALPGDTVISGEEICLEPFDWPRHRRGLTRYLTGPENAAIWRYLPIGPFDSGDPLGAALSAKQDSGAWRVMTIVARESGEALGTAGYMRLRPEHGSVEIGCVIHGRALQRSRAATEAHYLLASHVFDLGYRRYEWKCNAANEESRRAALRLGFTYEGTFRNDMVVRGRNRDTAWFSIIDDEWPMIEAGFEAWLDPTNFDADGRQKLRLSELRDAA